MATNSSTADDPLFTKIKDFEKKFRSISDGITSSSTHTTPSLQLGRPRDNSLGRPRSRPGLPLGPSPMSPATSRPRPGLLGGSGGGGRRQRAPPPTNIRVPDSAEIEAKYQEIMKLTGVLDFGDDGKMQCEQSDLEDMGELGHGTCGQVFTMKHRSTGKIMAVKQMRRSGSSEENKRIIMDLETVLKSHSCPYIVQCYGIFITESEVWICMELMSSCLDKLVKRLRAPIPEKILGKVTVSVLKALHYLKEEHGVIHRDVKPSNILLDVDGSVKLCDFGISGRLVDSKAITRTGTACAGYMAPERIQPPDPTNPDYDIRADVWSLGVTLVELAAGEFPFIDCGTDFEVLSRVLTSDPPSLPTDKNFSSNFIDFVEKCLTKDYTCRPKYRKLLEHPFIHHYEDADVDIAAWYKSVTSKQSSTSSDDT